MARWLSKSAAWREVARRCEVSERERAYCNGLCARLDELLYERIISAKTYHAMRRRMEGVFRANAEDGAWIWIAGQAKPRIIAAGLLAAMTE